MNGRGVISPMAKRQANGVSSHNGHTSTRISLSPHTCRQYTATDPPTDEECTEWNVTLSYLNYAINSCSASGRFSHLRCPVAKVIADEFGVYSLWTNQLHLDPILVMCYCQPLCNRNGGSLRARAHTHPYIHPEAREGLVWRKNSQSTRTATIYGCHVESKAKYSTVLYTYPNVVLK